MPFKIPADVLDRLWPHASPALKAGIVATAPAITAKYRITPLVDLIDLLAQCSEETAGGIATEENLNYSASRLMQVWPSRFPSLAYAETYAHNPRALANNVYSGRGGNVSGSNDGWNFRGRGLIQLTFRDNYLRIGKVAGLDLINHPELASDPQHALECAAAYWADAGINPIAASGDFTRETIRINGGTTNMAARLAWKKLWTAALTVPNTTVSAGQPAAPAGGDGGPLAAGTATKEKQVSNGTSAGAAAAPATPATPVVAPPIVVDYGDVINQILSVLAPVLGTLATDAIDTIPGGSLILGFLGPNMVSQFVASAAASVAPLLAAKSFSVSPTNVIETMVLNAINTELPAVGAFLSGVLPGWITAEVAKVTAAKPAAAAAPAAAAKPAAGA